MGDSEPSLRTLNKMQEQYEFIEKIGKGGFGLVYKARNLSGDEIVAIKLVRTDGNGIPGLLIREIALLKELHHDNIVRLLENLSIGNDMFLVFECLDCDLSKYMRLHPLKARDPERIKNFLYQILSGVAYCHSKKIIHRDLKPANLLIDTGKDVVKIADFGLAREIGVPSHSYATKVGTYGYRAPELVIGNSQYSTHVDVWSVGCIFAEMVRQDDMFPGAKLNQLAEMLRTLSPPDQTWPNVDELAKEVPRLEPDGVDLLAKMLRLNKDERITAEAALNHGYFENVRNAP